MRHRYALAWSSQRNLLLYLGSYQKRSLLSERGHRDEREREKRDTPETERERKRERVGGRGSSETELKRVKNSGRVKRDKRVKYMIKERK